MKIENIETLREFINYEKNMYPSKSIIFKYVKYTRYLEYFYNKQQQITGVCGGGVLCKLSYSLLYRIREQLGIRLGYDIPVNVFDKGLKIFHRGHIIVHKSARVGQNCTIIGSACLGKKGTEKAPQIGNNCELGMNCVLIGDIRIGNNVYIGAGAVVVNSFAENDISIAGVPAKVVKNNAGR